MLDQLYTAAQTVITHWGTILLLATGVVTAYQEIRRKAYDKALAVLAEKVKQAVEQELSTKEKRQWVIDEALVVAPWIKRLLTEQQLVDAVEYVWTLRVQPTTDKAPIILSSDPITAEDPATYKPTIDVTGGIPTKEGN